MAIAIDASSPIRFAGTPANDVDITSASLTPPNNSVLICCVNADSDGGGSDITISVSDSQTLTWTNRIERDFGDAGAQNGHASIWTAVIATGASMTVSVRRTAGNGSTNRISVKIYVVTGADTTTPNGATGEGSSTTNDITPTVYTSTVNNSRGFGCATDWNQLGTPVSTDTEDAADYSGAISVLSLHKAADTTPNGSSVAMNFDAGGAAAAAWNWVALEIRPAVEEDETVKGTSILDFGAFPGKSDASLVVTGQSAIVAGSLVEAWVRLEATAEHSADEHMLESIKVFAGNIVAGTGFTIYGMVVDQMTEQRPQIWTGKEAELPGSRLYGTWTVAWAWA